MQDKRQEFANELSRQMHELIGQHVTEVMQLQLLLKHEQAENRRLNAELQKLKTENASPSTGDNL